MNWGFIVKYAPMYVRAAGLTLRIGGQGILLSMIVGLICLSLIHISELSLIHI